MLWGILAGVLILAGLILAMVTVASIKRGGVMEFVSHTEPGFLLLCFGHFMAGNPRMLLAFALVIYD